MKNSPTEKNRRGFITAIVVVIVAIVLLRIWFGFNIIDFLKSPGVAEWTSYIRDVVIFVWNHYLKEISVTIWNFFLNIVNNFRK